jgi:hypothetical protein
MQTTAIFPGSKSGPALPTQVPGPIRTLTEDEQNQSNAEVLHKYHAEVSTSYHPLSPPLSSFLQNMSSGNDGGIPGHTHPDGGQS